MLRRRRPKLAAARLRSAANPSGMGSWYVDPHGFAHRAWAVDRRRLWQGRIRQRLVPEATLWRWADTDGARAIRGTLPGVLELPPAAGGPDFQSAHSIPELPRGRIHPLFTPESSGYHNPFDPRLPGFPNLRVGGRSGSGDGDQRGDWAPA